MTIKRVFLTLLAALLLPGLAFAQSTTRATFTVQKIFDDGNDGEATVNIECFTGVPLDQSATRAADGGDFEVEFVVESFDNGQLDCNITEDDLTGYSADYEVDDDTAESTADSDDLADACEFEDVSVGSNVCIITNSPDPVTVEVCKDWVIEGSGGDAVNQYYDLTLGCYNEIVGGYYHYYAEPTYWTKGFYGTGDSSSCGTANSEHTAAVIPDWDGGTDCWVEENIGDSAVETDLGDCPDLHVNLGGEDVGSGSTLVENVDSCTVTNTVFFEGIPTLSQYGMAILALLMLGVGFVGFRRFV